MNFDNDNFDNAQAAISQKYVVCVRVKRRCDSHTGIQLEARHSKLSSFCKIKKTTAVVFLSVNFGSCHNKPKLSSFFSFVLLICQ